MIAVDTNLLVYAHRRDAEWHAQARHAINGLATSAEAWAVPWPCIHEFLAIVTHPKIYRPPSTRAQAIAQVEAWLESPSLVLLAESERYWIKLRKQIESSQSTGARIHDARIAALCLDHAVDELWSGDRDFSRFPDLPVKNPLIDSPPE